MSAKESALILLVKNLNTSTNRITKNIEYTIDPHRNIEETTLYYYQTLEVEQHHTMDPIRYEILYLALIPIVKNLNRSTNIITTNTEYTIDPQRKIEETTLYYYQTLEVGQHHTMDHIMEGILSCSLASSRGLPPNEL
jgi:hypothetical protein